MLRRLTDPYVWRRIFLQRLTEPVHLNILALPIAPFGTFRSKVTFDLIVRQHYAYGLLRAADRAKRQGLKATTVVEFGVAEGAGLMNMCRLAQRTTNATGIRFNILGFDTGVGNPVPVDYRDHPDLYHMGDYPMLDADRLRRSLSPNARLIIGDSKETVPQFLCELDPCSPLGFVVLDVDYYSSARNALSVFADPEPSKYMPETLLYIDNVLNEQHNDWCGERLAVREFNRAHAMRKLQRDTFLKHWRVFKNAVWLDQIYLLEVLDHPRRSKPAIRGLVERTGNPYFRNLP
jgi:hypothetical protein